MKLQDLLNELPAQYSKETEDLMIEVVNSLKLHCLNDELTSLLAFAITDHYNKLARAILEKDYLGKNLDMKAINKAITEKSQVGYSMLHFTAQFGNKEMLFYFLDHGVEITLDSDGASPLHALAYAEGLTQEAFNQIIEKLNSKWPNLVELKDKNNLLAMHYAAHQNNMNYLKALVAYEVVRAS